ncbi:helix-turn-helix domain-containing protein [Kitasatospora sp. MBT63]|uniref:helix-turn-helix domain-containing protein n=1 Tax=Kitasatospora sp. MBT63 TaxID=1444768 RepID=UPI00068B372D|nr:AraC family transcriptional regulator [Kitasatospora sp. MBT63]
MPRDPADQARSVHPAMAEAVLRVLERRGGRGAFCATTAALLERGVPVPEQLHARQVTKLYGFGPAALTEAADLLLADPPAPLAALPATSDVRRLAGWSALVEPWFHVGHRTRVVADGEGGLTFRHQERLGRPPQAADSLFVGALYAAGTAALVGRAPQLRLVAADGSLLPPSAAWGRSPVRPGGWRLSWDGGPARTPLPALAAVRGWIARDPAGPWRLARAAERLGCSPRTLQRELAAEGTAFQVELVSVRLAVAAQLIARTALPLAEVAAAAGFADHAHLTRRFCREYGCSPSGFRAGGGEAAPRVAGGTAARCAGAPSGWAATGRR